MRLRARARVSLLSTPLFRPAELSRKEGCPGRTPFLDRMGPKAVSPDFKAFLYPEFPQNNQRRFSVAFAAPHGKKSGFLCFLPPLRPCFWALVHIGKATSSIREDWRLWLAGERSLAFFVSTQNNQRHIMSNRPLSLWYPVWNQLYQSDFLAASIPSLNVVKSRAHSRNRAHRQRVLHGADGERHWEYAEAIARRMAGKGVAA